MSSHYAASQCSRTPDECNDWRTDIELIESADTFRACVNEWSAVYEADSDADIFLSHEWLDDLYQRRSSGICVLAWRNKAGERCAFLPLRRRVRANRRKRRFDNVIGMAGNDWADHTGLLCLPQYETEAIPALAVALQDMHWRRLDLEYLKISSKRWALFMSAFADSDFRIRALPMNSDDGKSSLAISPVVHLPETFEGWLQSGLSPGTRQRIRRFRRRLTDRADLQIRQSTSNTQARDIKAFHSLWLEPWRSVKRSSAKHKADMYCKIIEDGLRRGHMRLLILDQGDHVVAAHASYSDSIHRALSFFVGARDPEFDALPSGLLLHAHDVQWAIESGYRRYKLLRGDESYKYSLGAVDQRLISVRIRPRMLQPECVFLQPQCRDEVLSTLLRAQEKASGSTINRLYGQLLDSWPGDRTVLEQYAQWLTRQGELDMAEAITQELEAGR